MPLEGTTQRPSFDLSLSFPMNPLRRAKVVSAGVIPELRKHSRVRLYTQYVRRSMLPLRLCLVNPGPAALDQNHQNGNKEHAGDEPNNRYTVHVVLLSLNERSTYETIPEW